jgi:hypothetical protein
MQELSSDTYMTKYVWPDGGDFKTDNKTEKYNERDDLETDTDVNFLL